MYFIIIKVTYNKTTAVIMFSENRELSLNYGIGQRYVPSWLLVNILLTVIARTIR